jgi:chromosome partitioning protein
MVILAQENWGSFCKERCNMKAKILMIANQKGGVGKTTTTVNLAHALALRGKRTLIVDLDPQGQVTTALGMDHENGVFRWLIGGRQASEVVRSSRRANLWVIPGDKDTATVQGVWDIQHAPIGALLNALEPLRDGLNYILIDSGPSVGRLQSYGLFAANVALIPTAVDFLAVEGVARVLETMQALASTHGWRGTLLGILPTFYDTVTNESAAILQSLETVYPGQVLQPPVRRATALRECSAQGLTIWELDPNGRTAGEYGELTKAVLERV